MITMITQLGMLNKNEDVALAISYFQAAVEVSLNWPGCC